jgi:hypothetical protein
MTQNQTVNLVYAPQQLAYDADFAVPVALTRSVFQAYIDNPVFTAEEQEGLLWKILWYSRKEIDCWLGDMDEYPIDFMLPTGRHPCCGSFCTDHVELKGIYRRDAHGESELILMMPNEEICPL